MLDASFYRDALDQPVALAVEPLRVSPVSHTPPSPTGVLDGSSTPGGGPHATLARNARWPRPLADSWSEAWRTDLSPRRPPTGLLWAEDRIVLTGRAHWELFTREGRSLEVGERGAGEVVLDPAAGLLYSVAPSGVLNAHRLEDGGLAFSLDLTLGSSFERVFLAPTNGRLIAAGVQLSRPHSPPQALSCLEAIELGRPRVVEDGFLESHSGVGRWFRKTSQIEVASSGQIVALASPGWLHHLDLDLTAQAAWDLGGVTPLELSLDELGRSYLVVGTASGRALWVLSPEGQLLFERSLPDGELLGPPAVGFDYTSYVFLEDRVLAFAPDGGLRFEVQVPYAAGWRTVPGGGLVLTAGHELWRLDSWGSRTVLFTAEESLVAPPAWSAGSLVVASRHRLFGLHTP